MGRAAPGFASLRLFAAEEAGGKRATPSHPLRKTMALHPVI